MTQALVRPTVSLELVDIRLSETVDWIRRKPSDDSELVSDRPNALCLRPGQAESITLDLQNTSRHPLQWRLELVGNFPLTWSSSSPSGTSDLSRQSSEEKGIFLSGTIAGDTAITCSFYLTVPDDFFEAQTALVDQASLQLDYEAEIFLRAEPLPAQSTNEHQEDGNESQDATVRPRTTDEPPHKPGYLVGYRRLDLQVSPASRYIRLLPQIFQSEDFMVRFLSVFEQTFDPTLEMWRSLWAYLDPLTAPRSMLPFLSKWVAWDLTPRWTLQQQRRLMREAVKLYRMRGTRQGVQYYLHLYTNLRLDEDVPEDQKQISVSDDIEDVFVFGEAAFGEGMMIGGGQPFHFNVILRPDTLEEYERLDTEMIQQVIERVKPAFCTHTLDIIHPTEPASQFSDNGPPLPRDKLPKVQST